MSITRARAHLEKFHMADRMLELDQSCATVELAALAVGCEPARIAKSLTFKGPAGPLMVVAAGDAKIDNAKFKQTFGLKAKMLDFAEVEPLIGHAVGGVCPFGIEENVSVYLDKSLQRFEIVYPSCGGENTAIGMTLPELEAASLCKGWVDVCKLPVSV